MTPAVLLLLALAGDRPALPAGGGPVRGDAEEVRYLYRTRQGVFSGKPHVRLTRDGMELTCRKLVADNDEQGRISRAVCSGEVRLVRGPRVVTCETATYEDAAGRGTCEGSPELRDGSTTARGDRLVYELSTDEVTLTPAVILMPQDQVEARKRELGARKRAEAGK